MSAAAAIRAAQDGGVRISVSGSDLTLNADSEPPAEVLETIRQHKAEIVAFLTLADAGGPLTVARVTQLEAAKPELRWSNETQDHVNWFLASEPPTEPFEFYRGVTVARPVEFWESLRGDVSAGPCGPTARTGALQQDLRRLYELFCDVEREAIQQIDGVPSSRG